MSWSRWVSVVCLHMCFQCEAPEHCVWELQAPLLTKNITQGLNAAPEQSQAVLQPWSRASLRHGCIIMWHSGFSNEHHWVRWTTFRLLLMNAGMQQKRLHSTHIIIIIVEAIADTFAVSGTFFIEGMMKHYEFHLHSQVPTSSGRHISAVDRQRCGPLTSTTSFISAKATRETDHHMELLDIVQKQITTTMGPLMAWSLSSAVACLITFQRPRPFSSTCHC